MAAGRDLGVVDMRDVAPTLARLLGVRLDGAEGRALDVDGRQRAQAAGR